MKLSELENEFYRHLPGIKDGIFERLVERGTLPVPARLGAEPLAGRRRSCSAGLIIGLGSTLGAEWLDMTPLPFIIAAVVERPRS